MRESKLLYRKTALSHNRRRPYQGRNFILFVLARRDEYNRHRRFFGVCARRPRSRPFSASIISSSNQIEAALKRFLQTGQTVRMPCRSRIRLRTLYASTSANFFSSSTMRTLFFASINYFPFQFAPSAGENMISGFDAVITVSERSSASEAAPAPVYMTTTPSDAASAKNEALMSQVKNSGETTP